MNMEERTSLFWDSHLLMLNSAPETRLTHLVLPRLNIAELRGWSTCEGFRCHSDAVPVVFGPVRHWENLLLGPY